MATRYKEDLKIEVLRGQGEFRAYFKLYDELFQRGTGNHIIEFESPLQRKRNPIQHEDVTAAVRVLKANNRITSTAMRVALRDQTHRNFTPQEFDFIVNLAVQSMTMIDANVGDSHGSDFRIGKYRHATWLPEECFVDFVSRCFPQVLAERRGRVAFVLDKRKSLKAWKLKKRGEITLKGTDNLAEHLLYDPSNRVISLFHHAEYLRAHLNLWEGIRESKDVGIAAALERGTLSPRLLVETLHSLQSVLFRYDDDRSMSLLASLIKKRGFDSTCSVPEGYKMFDDTVPEDFQYVYWGERLAVLYHAVQERPPRTGFQKWLRWQTSESNSFLIAMLALAISIFVGILSLGLSAVQIWISWQAWQHPVQISTSQ
ncbi:hypothetical protein B0T22DRAFT_527513 [Podospora appendiculata]|uniref:Uncharacterized protein n=1 Tax=Podospora appendiculata TaxID=314037 RepID=A0AAE0X854_9PEZI|nr:hypothetical protein B0T22DRAFT_527513 [Podospora appendiculata]